MHKSMNAAAMFGKAEERSQMHRTQLKKMVMQASNSMSRTQGPRNGLSRYVDAPNQYVTQRIINKVHYKLVPM